MICPSCGRDLMDLTYYEEVQEVEGETCYFTSTCPSCNLIISGSVSAALLDEFIAMYPDTDHLN